MTMHSKEMADTILRIAPKLDGDKLLEAFHSMGPACLFDDPENEEQVKGAMIVLKWVEDSLNYVPG